MTEYFVEKFYNEYAIKQEDTIVAVLDSGTNARKVCNLLNEQEETIQRLKEIREEQTETILKQKRKIKELTAQLKTDEEDDICIKCKHEYLVQQNDGYYISKCKKGFDECSKGTIKYCEDFELGGDVDE